MLELSVVARAHPKWGERAMAFVLLRPQARSKWKSKDGEFETELKKFARTKLPGFACPEWVQIVGELPVSVFKAYIVVAHTTGRKHRPARYSRLI